MTKKFMKDWKCPPLTTAERNKIQCYLNGGIKICRVKEVVMFEGFMFNFSTPGTAVKFAAALNAIRRPLRLIKKDLDADWCSRVKARDEDTCILCGVVGRKATERIDKKTKRPKVTYDSLTAHHWLKTKLRSRMARWARPCGVTVHFTEHIHQLHENPCWVGLEPIYRHVAIVEGEQAIKNALKLSQIEVTEAAVRALWLERFHN